MVTGTPVIITRETDLKCSTDNECIEQLLLMKISHLKDKYEVI